MQLIALYQPIIDIKTEDTVGYEALARFQGLSGELTKPAEAFQVVDPLKTSLDMIYIAIKERAKYTDNNWYVSVNLPAPLFVSNKVRNFVQSTLSLHDVKTTHLMVELTEETPWRTEELTKAFAAWTDLGVKTAIDDYGSKYNNKEIVRACRPYLVKIDRTILLKAQSRNKVLEQAAGLAHSVGAECVVEGVETAKQAELVRSAGINWAQGFLYGKPSSLGSCERAYP